MTRYKGRTSPKLTLPNARLAHATRCERYEKARYVGLASASWVDRPRLNDRVRLAVTPNYALDGNIDTCSPKFAQRPKGIAQSEKIIFAGPFDFAIKINAGHSTIFFRFNRHA